MALYQPYNPGALIPKALFNFDAFGGSNFRLTGEVRVSVSDAFVFATWKAVSGTLSGDIYSALDSGAVAWAATQLDSINSVTSNFANFINVKFDPVVDFSGSDPAAVGTRSDINVSLISRPDLNFYGESAGGDDAAFGYGAFGQRAVGHLATSVFQSGTDEVADSAQTRLIYDRLSGKLLYDADGSGNQAAPVEIALIANHPANLSAGDFLWV